MSEIDEFATEQVVDSDVKRFGVHKPGLLKVLSAKIFGTLLPSGIPSLSRSPVKRNSPFLLVP